MYFTRERHRRDRALLRPVLEREARSQHARPAGEGVPVPLLQRRRARPPLGLALPRLLHQALWRTVRRLRVEGRVPREHRRGDRIPVRPLPRDRARSRGADEGLLRRRAVRGGRAVAKPPARGAVAARAPARRQRRRRHARRRRRRARGDGRQRAGLPGPRRRALRPPVVLPRQREPSATRPRLPRSSCSSTTAAPSRSRRRSSSSTRTRCWRRRCRRGAADGSSCAPPSAATSGACSSWLSATLVSRSNRTSSRPSAGASSASRRSTACSRRSASTCLPVRIECFDISNLMGTNTTASMVVFEGGAPKKADYRRFNVRGGEEGVPDDFAAMEEVLGRRYAAWETPAGPQPARSEAQRVVRDAAEHRRDRRRPGPACPRASGRCRASATRALP